MASSSFGKCLVLWLSCLAMAVSAQDDSDDDDTKSTSAVVWILIAFSYVLTIVVVIPLVYFAYNAHQRLKKIEYRFSRRGSVSSDHYYFKTDRDSRRSSARSNNGRYQNNPIRQRTSRSPRNSPQPNAPQPHVAIPIEALQQQVAYDQINGRIYETLANGFAGKPEEPQQSEQHGEPATSTVPAVTNAPQECTTTDDGKNENHDGVEMIPPSYTTYLDRTGPQVIDDGLEYSDVFNSTPPTPDKNERIRCAGSVKKGKRPPSSEEYTDPVHKGVANMKRMKESDVVMSKTPDVSPQKRRASEPAVITKNRKDFEDWPLKSLGTTAPPTLTESDL